MLLLVMLIIMTVIGRMMGGTDKGEVGVVMR